MSKKKKSGAVNFSKPTSILRRAVTTSAGVKKVASGSNSIVKVMTKSPKKKEVAIVEISSETSNSNDSFCTYGKNAKGLP